MIFTKETWVVLPAFTFCFDLCLSHTSLRSALRRSTFIAIAPLIYILIYFLTFPGDKAGYYAGGLRAAAKIPHAWAVFSYLTPLQPSEFPVGVMEVLSLVIMGLLAWLGWRKCSFLMGIGFAFFFLPFLPILPVELLPSRYTMIPLIGFLIIICSGIQELLAVLNKWGRQIGIGVVGVLVFLMLWVNLIWLQGDGIDAQQYYALHARLLAEARAFLPYLPRDRPLVVVRLENENPLVTLSSHESYGIPKLYFQRQYAPYGLIDWAALLSYTLEPVGGPLYVEVSPDTIENRDYAVLGHIRGGFTFLPKEASTAREAIEIWKNRGAYVRILKPWERKFN